MQAEVKSLCNFVSKYWTSKKDATTEGLMEYTITTEDAEMVSLFNTTIKEVLSPHFLEVKKNNYPVV